MYEKIKGEKECKFACPECRREIVAEIRDGKIACVCVSCGRQIEVNLKTAFWKQELLDWNNPDEVEIALKIAGMSLGAEKGGDSMSEHDLKRLKEGVSMGVRMLADSMRRSQERDDAFIAILVPLLDENIKRKIIDDNKWRSAADECDDEELLKQHLIELIMDFDCNIHYLEENEMPALAEIINKNPLVSFFFNDD